VPQGRMIFPALTVEENIKTGLRPGKGGIPAEIYDFFPVLGEMKRRRGGNLSGGQQQQLAIARALASGPRVLLLDEPTEGIQPSIIKDIEAAIRALAATGQMAILLVEQYLDFAERLADKYVIMAKGAVVAAGSTGDLRVEMVRQHLAV